MWKLIPMVMLAGCAATGSDPADTEAGGTGGGRTAAQMDLPLVRASTAGQPAEKAAQRQDTRVRISATGAWDLTTKVRHNRLRCATYQTGIQLGQGSPGCSDVRWLTPVQLGTRQTHCNSAARIHRGGGRIDLADAEIAAASCVRIVTRCDGPC